MQLITAGGAELCLVVLVVSDSWLVCIQCLHGRRDGVNCACGIKSGGSWGGSDLET
jgi:hypothetical protein